ncbi:hypothetical protein [Bradyrhizobium genosp. P]|uniref:hypothetical protein n=1 Tax=Bradyrhizobium genosp. P TaxID=83641 RepID=UPI003CE7B9BC
MSFVLQIASPPDRDELVTEVWWNDQLVAEVRRSADGKQFIDLYASPSRIPWSFEFQEWLAVMNKVG